MSVTLTYKEINNKEFNEAIGKLGRYDNWSDQRIAYNVAKFFRRYKPETELCWELYLKLLKKFAVLDDKGNIKKPEGAGAFEVPTENLEAYNKAMKDFEAVSFEIDIHKMPVEKLAGCGLSAIDLNAIEALLIPMDLSAGL